jgi:MFS transporter, PPP family, 3-phenylpropionic acid transporter
MMRAIDNGRGGSADLARFLLLFSVLYMSFGVVSPFLPGFLTSRGVLPEQLGLILSLGTLVRLFAGPMAGHVADRYQALRKILAMCTFGAAIFAGALSAAHGFSLLIVISLGYAALLAPTTMLADALALRSASGDRASTAHFEYGWVRGAGSAAFIAGSLLSGQAVELLGAAAAAGAQAVLLVGAAWAAIYVPEQRKSGLATSGAVTLADRTTIRAALLRNRPFLYLVVVAAIILGSHAMHDAFAMIAWNTAGISPGTGSVLWSAAVGAEIVVFFFIGPWLLRSITPTAAMAIAALAAALRWSVMSQNPSVAVLALIQPLHGVTFALLHLACMRILVLVTPAALAATAQTMYGFAIALASAAITLLSGYLYAGLGLNGFLIMAVLALMALPVVGLLSRSLPREHH